MPAWLSFSCQDDSSVSHGGRFSDCAALAEEHSGIIAIGVNCTPPQYVENLLNLARQASSRPLLAYPNSGEHWRAEDNTWLGAPTQPLASYTQDWLQAGATLVGGCCRSTPGDIRAIAEQVHATA